MNNRFKNYQFDKTNKAWMWEENAKVMRLSRMIECYIAVDIWRNYREA